MMRAAARFTIHVEMNIQISIANFRFQRWQCHRAAHPSSWCLRFGLPPPPNPSIGLGPGTRTYDPGTWIQEPRLWAACITHVLTRQTDRQRDKQIDRHTDRQKDRKTDKQTDRQRDRETNRQPTDLGISRCINECYYIRNTLPKPLSRRAAEESSGSFSNINTRLVCRGVITFNST